LKGFSGVLGDFTGVLTGVVVVCCDTFDINNLELFKGFSSDFTNILIELVVGCMNVSPY
jgi:hypothetical protein